MSLLRCHTAKMMSTFIRLKNSLGALLTILLVFSLASTPANADSTGPRVSIKSLTPIEVDISSGPKTLVLEVEVSDDSGVDLSKVPQPYFYNNTDLVGTRINGIFSLFSGDSKNGIYRSSITIPSNTKPGDWTAGFIAFYDINGFASTNGGYSEAFKVIKGLIAVDSNKNPESIKKKPNTRVKKLITCTRGKVERIFRSFNSKCPKGWIKK